MGCRRASSSTLVMVIVLAVSLVTLDRPTAAHARHVKDLPMATTAGEHPSADQKTLQGASRKLGGGVEHTKKTDETVQVMKAGSPAGKGPQNTLGQDLGRGAKMVVVAREGPRPHPKKHN